MIISSIRTAPAGGRFPAFNIRLMLLYDAASTSIEAPIASGGEEMMTIKFRYKKPDGNTSRLLEHPVIDRLVPVAKTSDNFRFAASVAQFGMLLRNSEFRQSSSYTNCWNLGRSAMGEDKEGYRSEFLKIVRNAEALAQQNQPREETHTRR